MTADQELLIEQELCSAIRAFHDLEDKEKRYAYSKEYFWAFCERYGLDPKEVFPIVKRTLKRKSEFVFSDYTDSVKFLDSEIKKEDGEERD